MNTAGLGSEHGRRAETGRASSTGAGGRRAQRCRVGWESGRAVRQRVGRGRRIQPLQIKPASDVHEVLVVEHSRAGAERGLAQTVRS